MEKSCICQSCLACFKGDYTLQWVKRGYKCWWWWDPWSMSSMTSQCDYGYYMQWRCGDMCILSLQILLTQLRWLSNIFLPVSMGFQLKEQLSVSFSWNRYRSLHNLFDFQNIQVARWTPRIVGYTEMHVNDKTLLWVVDENNTS